MQDSAKSGHSFSSEYKTALLFNSFLPEKTQKELVTLGAYADQNIPSANDLQKQFITYVPAIEKALDKDVAKTWTEQLQSQLSHLVVIHRIGAPINMPVLSNVSVPLARMDLKETVSAIQKLPPNVQLILSEWIKNVQAREQINTSAKIIADDIVTSGLDSLSQQDSLK